MAIHEAGETAAKLFTLTKTCNRHQIDPFAYLQDVYARLPTMSPDELPSLLPDVGSRITLNTSFKSVCKKRSTVLVVRASVARSDGARQACI